MEALAMVLTVVVFLLLLVGILGAIKPSLVKQNSRLKAFFSYFGIAFVLLIIDGVIIPDPDKTQITVESQKYEDKKLGIIVPNGVKEEVIKLFEKSWPKVIEQCPGLHKYASSLTFDGMDDNFDSATTQYQRLSIQFLIPDDGGNIPNKYRAWGHRCFYNILRDGSQVWIPKDPCRSICLDKVIQYNDTHSAFSLSLKGKK